MRRLSLYFLLALGFKTCICVDWCYQSQMSCDEPCKGPAAWNEVNEACGGNRQSPINIVTKKTKQDSSLTAFKFSGYNKEFISMLKNDGQTVSVDVPLGASVSGGNLSNTYKALQLHFHWGNKDSPGSEHTVDGEQHPMELHILHLKDTYISVEEAQGDPTGLAILGFFFEESDSENKQYSALIGALAQVQDPESQAELVITLNSLIPSQSKLKDYYRYEGSRTFPDCSETVIWTVFQEPIKLSKDQLAAFTNLKFKDSKPMVDTFRPVQPRKGRVVYQSHSAVTAVLVSVPLVLLCASTALSWYQAYEFSFN